MQEKYTLNTALAAVVGLGCLAAVLYRVFLPAAVLPAVGLPAAAACSLLALAAEAYLSKGVPRRNWGLTLLLGQGTGQNDPLALSAGEGGHGAVCQLLHPHLPQCLMSDGVVCWVVPFQGFFMGRTA